jgi:hypothetical protein
MARLDAPSVIWTAAHVAIYAGGIYLVVRFLSNAVRKEREAQDDAIVPPPNTPMYSKE